MTFIDDKVLEVLEKLPSECAYIDYKEYPYIKGAKDYEFIHDVISMLNSEESIDHDKFIIVHVLTLVQELLIIMVSCMDTFLLTKIIKTLCTRLEKKLLMKNTFY